jgi:mannan endo-1,4-beta-mannosidase
MESVMDNADRRTFLAGATALATTAMGAYAQQAKAFSPATAKPAFITRNGTALQRDGKPYRFAGANIWYGAYLGADTSYGNRPRLVRELDRLQKLGITNLRILASAEEGRLKNSIKPGFRTADALNDALLTGLDFCMAEVAKRGMTAVLYLTNFWEWSGGMMTYLDYASGSFIDMGDPAHPWPAFADRNSDFYRSSKAVGMYHAYVRQLVSRTNSVTGVAYRNDPAIMAWQLCNEPRPGGSDAVIAKSLPDYYAWIESTAKLIRSIDGNHLVSLGHEGTIAANGREDVFIDAHQHIDYVTAHIWPLNWGWVNGKDLPGTWEAGSRKVQDYLDTHVRLAKRIGKPLIIEEFGFPRDGEGYDPVTSTEYRARYYKMIYDVTEASLATGGPVVGTNFWAWNGEARANHKDYRFKDGDLQYMGDPPHEPQGWYGNFDTDTTMLSLIGEHAARIAVG